MEPPEPPTPGSDPDPPLGADTARAYWRANLRLVLVLLALWATVSFGLAIVLVEPLNAHRLGGFPLGFWFAHQGAIYAFVVLILVYAVLADRLARRYGVD
jgi:putative solute:sodium symporter small subunit